MSQAANFEISSTEPLPPVVAYDLAAPSYDAWHWQSFWRMYEFPIVVEALERYQRGRQRRVAILDVGCGTGWYLDSLQPHCDEMVGIDASRGMLAVARHRLPGTLLLQRDACALPFAAGRFDVVLCTRVLSHLPVLRPALAEMARVLSPGGLLILSDVDAEHEYLHTRLPVASDHVFARTFKHAREPLFSTVEAEGFFSGDAHLINSSGTATPLRGRRARSDSVAAGWVATWQRDSSGPVSACSALPIWHG